MSQNAAFDDANIPVLTEVVQDKAGAPAAETAVTATVTASASLSEHDWSLLERRISERMLQQLQNRVDFVLEQRLRDSMADVLQHALAGLTEEIRAGLQETLEKIVVRAVAQEVAHLQTLKK